jgi:hypothetical protein
MQAYFIMADATPSVVYAVDWYMTYEASENNRLWFSDDYGKTWEMRDDPKYKNRYYMSKFESVMYKLNGKDVCQSKDYGSTWQKIDGKGYIFDGECGFDSCDFFGIGGSYPTDPWSIYYTNNWFDTYTIIPIGDEYVSGLGADVFRGGLFGEVYVTSGKFSGNTYKVSFSSDMGYHFRVVHQQKGYMDFMSDRKAGDFYIVTQQVVETQQPWGYYVRVCIEYHTDYGETLVGTYCHELQRHYLSVDCFGIIDLQAKIEDEKRHVSRVMCNEIGLDISGLPSGMYFIRITTETGVITKKIVKK